MAILQMERGQAREYGGHGNKDLLIAEADKGEAVVILPSTLYVEKVLDFLSTSGATPTNFNLNSFNQEVCLAIRHSKCVIQDQKIREELYDIVIRVLCTPNQIDSAVLYAKHIPKDVEKLSIHPLMKVGSGKHHRVFVYQARKNTKCGILDNDDIRALKGTTGVTVLIPTIAGVCDRLPEDLVVGVAEVTRERNKRYKVREAHFRNGYING